jgi:hypothetical protein
LRITNVDTPNKEKTRKITSNIMLPESVSKSNIILSTVGVSSQADPEFKGNWELFLKIV